MAKCTFYTQINTTTTDILFGEIDAAKLENLISQSTDGKVNIDVRISGGNNVLQGNSVLIKSDYVQIFVEGSYDLNEVTIVSNLPANGILPLNSIVSVQGTFS